MRKIFAGLLSLLGVGSAAAQSPSTPPDEVTSGFRSMVLGLTPGEIGLGPENTSGKVWGIVMDTGVEGGFHTLIVLADGTASLYFSNGGGIIGAGEREPVREASRELLATSNRFAGTAAPTNDTAPPSNGTTRFFLLTFDGLRSYVAQEVDLGEQRDPLSPLFHAAHAVITQLGLAQP